MRRIPFVDLDDDPLTDSWTIWGNGVVIPAIIALYGVYVIIVQKGFTLSRYGASSSLSGNDAVAAGVVLLCCALFANARYFWPFNSRLAEYSEAGKTYSLLAGLIAFGFLMVRRFTLI